MVTSPKQYWESIHQQKQWGKRENEQETVGETFLEIFHTCEILLDPRVTLYNMSSVTTNTDYVKRQRGIHHLTESSS